MVTVLLLFDFSKAFDKVFHVTLLRKLKAIGFSNQAIKWIGSYLSGRKQAVIQGDIRSTFLSINTGVPQGSILGPILFSLYLNDIADGFGKNISRIIFADDLQVYAQYRLADLGDTLLASLPIIS